MKIANPIYDSVFKFMMNDNKVAKLLLSAIIGAEILELEFKPTEINVPLKNEITIFRMDFKAKVLYADGLEQVIIIEIQKAKFHTDIMRFRRYLGEQYRDESNTILLDKIVTKKGNVIEKRKALPILSIYFLGHPLDHYKDIPVIKVERKYLDLATGDDLKEKDEFIECLTHDSYTIQIPYVKGHRRNDLEKVLHIFDQSEAQKEDKYHLLNIKEEDIPKRYRPILRRLLEAFADGQTRKMMKTEDEVLDELRNYARIVEDMKEEVEERKKEAEEERRKVEEQKRKVELINDSLEKAILEFIELGFSNEKIANVLDITIKQVEQIRNKK